MGTASPANPARNDLVPKSRIRQSSSARRAEGEEKELEEVMLETERTGVDGSREEEEGRMLETDRCGIEAIVWWFEGFDV